MKNLYEILDVPKDASESDIKKHTGKKHNLLIQIKNGETKNCSKLFKRLTKFFRMLTSESITTKQVKNPKTI